MTYLLDTNTCIVHLRARGTHGISQRLRALRAGEAVLAAIVAAELMYGALRSSNPQRAIQDTRAFCDGFRWLPFDDRAAQLHAETRADLAARGLPIGPNDLIIASTALAHNLILVTHNTREFSHVRGLRLEDWQTP
jgi:tRNA(fMet)-specific endonuclease VapC